MTVLWKPEMEGTKLAARKHRTALLMTPCAGDGVMGSADMEKYHERLNRLLSSFNDPGMCVDIYTPQEFDTFEKSCELVRWAMTKKMKFEGHAPGEILAVGPFDKLCSDLEYDLALAAWSPRVVSAIW